VTSRPDVQAVIPESARRILDLGCSTGALGAALKKRNGAFVLGVEIDPAYAQLAMQQLDRVVTEDAEAFLRKGPPQGESFDCLIGADVFEHLVDPWDALSRATTFLAPGSTVVISLPNVLHWRSLLRVVLKGRWPRDDEGIFDRTHLRWFTAADAVDLVEGAGLRLVTARPKYYTSGIRLALTKVCERTPLRRFLAYQWLVVAIKPH
jgi:2-polyprenyl-3-methyl-5-hydroxy-6-metoxy-1,4-benzoquinol methylase